MALNSLAADIALRISTLCHDTRTLLLSFLFIVLSSIAGVITIKAQKEECTKTAKAAFILLPILAMGILILRFGPSMAVIKGFLLFIILFLASISDIKTREAADHYFIMILITAFIDISISELPNMLLALLVVGLPQLIAAMLKPGSYGGADIKITSAAAFLLGVWKGLFALIIGLSAAILIPALIRLASKRSLKDGIPMLPYLSVGIFLSFIL